MSTFRFCRHNFPFGVNDYIDKNLALRPYDKRGGQKSIDTWKGHD